MELFINLFNVVLYQPLFNVLVLLYEYLPGHDFGVAVIVLTVLIRLLFYPLGIKSIKSQKTLQTLQPKIQEIQAKFKSDKEKQARETMELYKKEKINPFSGCLPLLIQLPILFALYQVFWKGLQPEALSHLYSFVPSPGTIDPTFLDLVNLAEPFWVLAIVAGIGQFFQAKMLAPASAKAQARKPKNQMAQFSNMMQKQMLYFFPIFTVLILLRLPSAIGIYWLVTTLFTIFQQMVILKKPT